MKSSLYSVCDDTMKIILSRAPPLGLYYKLRWEEMKREKKGYGGNKVTEEGKMQGRWEGKTETQVE